MLLEKDFANLKLELSVKAKNGLDFIAAATLLWSAIAFVWTQPNRPATNAYITLFMGGVMLPLAFSLSKVFKTTWTIKSNPLQPLGLWLNFAQLFYFPFLVFVYMKMPQHFIMTYGIITGAHFFPYAWFYNTKAFAVMAGVISLGCLALDLYLAPSLVYLISAFVAASLVVLGAWLWLDYRAKARLGTAALQPSATAATALA